MKSVSGPSDFLHLAGGGSEEMWRLGNSVRSRPGAGRGVDADVRQRTLARILGRKSTFLVC